MIELTPEEITELAAVLIIFARHDGEDTMGILMKQGAFHRLSEPGDADHTDGIVRLAIKVDALVPDIRAFLKTKHASKTK